MAVFKGIGTFLTGVAAAFLLMWLRISGGESLNQSAEEVLAPLATVSSMFWVALLLGIILYIIGAYMERRR